MQCKRCLNTDQKYFYLYKNQWYCRKCIQFGRVNVGEEIPIKSYTCKKHRVHPKLNFSLTEAQLKASREVVTNAKEGKDTLVYACCGAGKTEITYEVITYFLNAGKKVGFAISRRQVVLEIAARLKKTFPRLKVVQVCQGYTDQDDGDLIVCTMHQLYRYHQTFDLLIMDEVDAFPYKNNEVLESVAMNACKGIKVYLTATPSEKMLMDVKNQKLHIVELFTRPHGHPLIIPHLIRLPKMLQILHMLLFIHQHQGQWLIFVPTIQQANLYARLYSYINPCRAFTSKTENKEEIIEMFRNKEISVLFTSTILERGVTFKGIHILVLESDHNVFDEASLIQIAGRVGRDKNQPTGYALFYAEKKSFAIVRCISALNKMNGSL